MFMEFEGIDLPLRQNEVTEIQGWIRSSEGVALTCIERESETYHRGRVATAIERQSTLNLHAEHL